MKHPSAYREAQIDGVYFDPWRGDNYGYGSRWGLPILIVGESHYEWEEERWQSGRLMPRDTTTFMIQQKVDHVERRGFTTKIACAFLGRPPEGHEVSNFWHSVCFYNFVQESVGFGAACRPTQESFRCSENGFWNVVGQTGPRLVVIFSRAVWDLLQPHDPREVPTYEAAGALIAGLPHPSARSFISAENWYPRVTDVIVAAGGRTSSIVV